LPAPLLLLALVAAVFEALSINSCESASTAGPVVLLNSTATLLAVKLRSDTVNNTNLAGKCRSVIDSFLTKHTSVVIHGVYHGMVTKDTRVDLDVSPLSVGFYILVNRLNRNLDGLGQIPVVIISC
jgi:hypothetical protein